MPRKKQETDETPAAAPRKRAVAKKPAEPAVVEETPKVELLEAPSDDDYDRPVYRDVQRALTFRLDDQLYGLPIDSVQEIQQLVELMPLPDAAPALVGLIDIRGLVVPAIDLRLLVGMPKRPYSLETPMIFCRSHGRVACLIVDVVEDVVEVPRDSVQPPSNLYALADKMVGVCRLPQGLVLLFDPERLVPDEAMAATEGLRGAR